MSSSTDSPLNASGRFSRFSYLAWSCLISLVTVIAVMVLSIFSPDLFGNLATGQIGSGIWVLALIYLVLIYFIFIFIIRRLHDRNHSGWLSLLVLVPLVNIILALYLVFAPGDDKSNTYGAPRPTAGWETAFAWIYILLTVLAFVAGIFSGLMA